MVSIDLNLSVELSKRGRILSALPMNYRSYTLCDSVLLIGLVK